MAAIGIRSTAFGTPLMQFLACDTIEPGDDASYQLCKIIFEYHVLGKKIVEAPITMAMSQRREITVNSAVKDAVVKAFNDEWTKLDSDGVIFNVKRLSRAYGVSTVGLLEDGAKPDAEIDWWGLWDKTISFNVWDPLNTSGSLVLNQDPNAMDFLKSNGSVTVQNVKYHRSRCIPVLNGDPIYLSYTVSGYGYVGRSVYQACLYPLKSFLETMKTDDLVSRKAGIIIAMIKQAGSIVNNLMHAATGFKRSILKEAETDNVISIDVDEKIESINLEGVNVAMETSRKNILNNIAAGADVPAILLNEETFAEGFGEGTEDAKHVAFYIERFRREMGDLYAWMDKIVQHRAWNEGFFKALQKEHGADTEGLEDYKTAFYEWTNSFEATWPSILVEPESEQAKSDKVRFDAIEQIATTILPQLDPENKATMIQWIEDTIAALPRLFPVKMNLDFDALREFDPIEDQMRLMKAQADLMPQDTGTGQRENKSSGGAWETRRKKYGSKGHG